MKNIVIIAILFLGLSINLNSQTWGGVNSAGAYSNASNDAFRKGNVGIGFSSTGINYPLQVYNQSSGQGTKVLFGTNGSLIGSYGAADAVFQMQGIGTTANSFFSMASNVNGSDNFGLTVTCSGTYGASINYGANGTLTQMPFTIYGNSYERMRIRIDQGTKVTFGSYNSTGGLVGTAPAVNDAALQVISQFGASSFMVAANVNATATSYVGLKLSSSTTSANINVTTTTIGAVPLIFSTGATEAMRIWPSGAIGIGTGATSLNNTKLAVEGLISCRELKVVGLTAPWPDYVFDANYQRLSFSELHEYVNINHHLPYLPSAISIQNDNNSINVGETQVGIVRSIEELYLYMFDLKKENEELKKEIEALKAQH